MRHKTAWFYHVLSASVVPSVSVESALEPNDVLMTCFLRCVFERYDVKSQDHCSKKAAYRFVVDCGKPSLVAIFLAPKPRVAMRPMETLLCGSHHVVVGMPENTCDLREMSLVVYGYIIKSVMGVSVRY